MNQQLMVRLVPRHTLQMRFFLILAQPLKAHLQKCFKNLPKDLLIFNPEHNLLSPVQSPPIHGIVWVHS